MFDFNKNYQKKQILANSYREIKSKRRNGLNVFDRLKN